MSITKKNAQLDPTKCLSAINPRSLAEYEIDLMIAELNVTDGNVEEPISVLRLTSDDPIWEGIGYADKDGEWRLANRDLLLRGHRRCAGSCKIVDNPSEFSGTVVANAGKIPAIVYEGMSLQEAYDFTIDDKGKVPLKKRDIVKMVLRRFHDGFSYQEVALKFPQLLYGAFIKDGDVKYAKMSKEDDGRKRLKLAGDGLKNVLDRWFRTAFILGPAVETQLVNWVGKKKDRDDLPEGERVLMDCQMSAMGLLRDIRFQSVKDGTRSEDAEKVKLCTPVILIDRDKSTNVISVEGGNSEVNAAVEKAVLELYDPSTKEKKPKLPTEKERKTALLAVSKTGKAFAGFFNGESNTAIMEVDEWSHKMESRQIWRGEVLKLCQDENVEVNSFVKAFLDVETNCKSEVDYKECLMELIISTQKPQAVKKRKTA